MLCLVYLELFKTSISCVFFAFKLNTCAVAESGILLLLALCSSNIGQLSFTSWRFFKSANLTDFENDNFDCFARAIHVQKLWEKASIHDRQLAWSCLLCLGVHAFLPSNTAASHTHFHGGPLKMESSLCTLGADNAEMWSYLCNTVDPTKRMTKKTCCWSN